MNNSVSGVVIRFWGLPITVVVAARNAVIGMTRINHQSYSLEMSK